MYDDDLYNTVKCIQFQYQSKVLRCEPTKEPIVDYGKTSLFEGFQITLENTILFPAGGGQVNLLKPLTNDYL